MNTNRMTKDMLEYNSGLFFFSPGFLRKKNQEAELLVHSKLSIQLIIQMIYEDRQKRHSLRYDHLLRHAKCRIVKHPIHTFAHAN